MRENPLMRLLRFLLIQIPWSMMRIQVLYIWLRMELFMKCTKSGGTGHGQILPITIYQF